jgi:uncharacterized protein (TIGR03086 family)
VSQATDPLGLLERVVDQAGRLIARARADQARLPTPCSEFDLRALVSRIVCNVRVFVAMLTGAGRGLPGADLTDDDRSGGYRAATDSLLDTWRTHGLERTLQSPFDERPTAWALGQRITDLVVHSWDVAAAIGRSTGDFDPELAQVALGWARDNLTPQLRGQAFGPEVAVPETAPIYDRLVSFFGRDPTAVR